MLELCAAVFQNKYLLFPPHTQTPCSYIYGQLNHLCYFHDGIHIQYVVVLWHIVYIMWHIKL